MGRIWALKGRKTGSDPYCVYSKPLKSCFTRVKEVEGLGGGRKQTPSLGRKRIPSLGRKRIPSLGSKRNPEPWAQAKPQALEMGRIWALKGRKTGSDPYCVYSKPRQECVPRGEDPEPGQRGKAGPGERRKAEPGERGKAEPGSLKGNSKGKLKMEKSL